jgi:hypothetical protein
MNEEYSVGYSEGYQAGWNAAMDATPAAQPEPWKKRFEWLASQYWVEPEATFHLSLEETDDFTYYHKQLIEAIDAKMGIKGKEPK